MKTHAPVLCARCRAAAADELHHRLPRSRGGQDDDFNLAALCRKCHMWVESHPEQARRKGWTVAGYLLRGRGYVGPDEAYRDHYGDGRR